MKIKYDNYAGAVYLKLRRGKIAKTIKQNDQVILDVDKKGLVLGIEILKYKNNQTKMREYERNGVPLEINSKTVIA